MVSSTFHEYKHLKSFMKYENKCKEKMIDKIKE